MADTLTSRQNKLRWIGYVVRDAYLEAGERIGEITVGYGSICVVHRDPGSTGRSIDVDVSEDILALLNEPGGEDIVKRQWTWERIMTDVNPHAIGMLC